MSSRLRVAKEKLKGFFAKEYYLIDQLIVSGGAFLFYILLAQLAGLEAFSEYSLVLLVLLLCKELHRALVLLPLNVMIHKHPRHERYTSAVLLISTTASICLAFTAFSALLILGDDWSDSLSHKTLWPLVVVVLTRANCDVFRQLAMIDSRWISLILFDCINTLGLIVCLVSIVLLWDFSIAALLWGIALVNALSVLPFCTSCKFLIDVRSVTAVFVEHFLFAKWMIATVIAQWGSGNYLLIAAADTFGIVVMGYYRATQSLLGFANVVLVALESRLGVLGGSKQGRVSFARLVAMMYENSRIAILQVFAVTLMFFVLFEKFLHVFYGFDEAHLSDVFRFLVLLPLIGVFSIPLVVIHRSVGSAKMVFLAYITMVAFTLLSHEQLFEYFALDGLMIGLYTQQMILILILAISTSRLVFRKTADRDAQS